jgi:Flp pilus assembly protein TadD
MLFVAPAIGQQTAEEWIAEASYNLAPGKYDEAIKDADKAIDIDPQNAEGWWYKGVALARLGRMRDALIALAQAKELGTRNECNDTPRFFGWAPGTTMVVTTY